MPSTWGATASNQLITWDALKNAAEIGIFETKVLPSSFPTGNEAVTKAEAQSYVWIDDSQSPWSGYASNRCPPKSAFAQTNYCTLITITQGDLDNAIGNTSYPDNTVYVRTADSTISYTSANTYQICSRPNGDYPSNQYVYYYAYDTIQYGTSIISFSTNAVSCSSQGCVRTNYAVKYDAFTCPCTGGTDVTIYVAGSPTWTVGTLVSGHPDYQLNVAEGRYVYAGKCYRVQSEYTITYVKGQPFYQQQDTRITSVTNC